MDFIKKLTLADYISFIALFFAWLSILILISGFPNWAIISNMVAFGFDVIDGYTARKLKVDSKLGREIDSFVDIFTYILFASLLFFLYLSPHIFMSFFVGFVLILFGGLRLIRYNNEGILVDEKKPYYRGVTVLHLNFITILFYFIGILFPFLIWPLSFIILFLAFTMLNNYKTYKITHPLFFVSLISFFILVSLFFQYGYSK